MGKENWSSLNIKDKLAIITAIAAFIIGWGLSIAGFIVPPTGEVSSSVLFILGQSLVYAASVFGITAYFNTETKRMRSDFRMMIKEEERKLKEDEVEQ